MAISTLKIKKFDINSMCKNPTIIINAKRGSGKSIAIRQLINHFNVVEHYRVGVLCSRSEKVDPFYGNFFPDSYIYDDCAIAMEKVLRRQRRLISKNKQRKEKHLKLLDTRLLLVLDDVVANAKEWNKSEDMKEVMFNGRHYDITFIIAVQDTVALPPASRNNFDYVFLFNNDITSEIQKIYQHFAGIFDCANSFREVLAQVTENYGILVIIRREAKSNKLEDKIAVFKADITLKPSMFGCDKFKKLHSRYYDKNWMGHEDETRDKYGMIGKNKNKHPVRVELGVK